MILLVLSTCAILLAFNLSRISLREKALPPGPPVIPLLGNLLVFPRAHLHLQFTQWAKQYGGVFSLKVFNKTVIVLNTPTAVRDLIDRRSASCSNRPASIIADMITPGNLNMGTGRYANETWKTLRKAAHNLLKPENINTLLPYQHAEASQLMWDILHQPKEFYHHITRFFVSFALGTIYGKRAPTMNTPEAKAFFKVHREFIHALEIGTMPPVDLFPILAYIPARWAPWKTAVYQIRDDQEVLYRHLLDIVERRINDGRENGGFMELALKKRNEWDLTQSMLVHLGGTLLEGSDTASASLLSFVLALTAYPHVQRKAHAEIDLVVGRDRSPTLEDIPNLPYVQAVVKEANRFRPAGPLGVPHQMTQDEVIDGVLYPKDAVIFLNIWGIGHDPAFFERPEEFMPERFLTSSFGTRSDVVDDPARRENLIFGGGRRVCPGIASAKSSMDINVANLLWGFTFSPATDPVTGNEIPPNMMNYAPGITATPLPFDCTITVRSPEHAATIERTFANASACLAQYELELSDEDRRVVEETRRAGSN